MIKEIEDSNVTVLALSYKNGSFNVSVIEYTSNHEKYKEAYKTGNIALYFLPRMIKRLSGNAGAKGKDIIAQFNDRLIKYGYRIERGKIVGVVHTVTDYDAESIAKVLRKINNAMHRWFKNKDAIFVVALRGNSQSWCIVKRIRQTSTLNDPI